MMLPAEVIAIGSTLATLLKNIVNNVNQDDDCLINHLCLDSRDVEPGDCFFAIAGSESHGLDFVEEALKRGAVAVLWQEDGVHSPQLGLLAEYHDVSWVGVPQLDEKLGEIADRFYDSPSKEMNVIGVTGTNGKTSVGQFLSQALNEDHPCGVIGTIGNGMFGHLESGTHTTPDPITLHSWLDEYRAQGAWNTVMEVSSHGLDQSRVVGVDMDVAIFTNLSRDHLDYHGDMDAYADSKRKLFQIPSVKHAVINADDIFGRSLIDSVSENIEVISFGFDEANAVADVTVKASQLKQDMLGSHFRIDSPWGKARVNTPLLGRFNVSNLLATFAAMMALDISFDQAILRIEKCRAVSGRMEVVEDGGGQPMIVVDYAHTPDALEHALTALAEHMPKPDDNLVGGATAQDIPSRLWCVFGCGGDRDKGKRALMGEIAERLADEVIVTNDNPRNESPQDIVDEILAGMQKPEQVTLMFDRGAAIRKALTEANKQDVILIAGKGHEQYQIVSDEKLAYAGDVKLIRHHFKKNPPGGRS